VAKRSCGKPFTWRRGGYVPGWCEIEAMRRASIGFHTCAHLQVRYAPPTAFTALCVPSLPLCRDVELTVVFFETKSGENIQAGNCNSVVEKLADYLKENNY